MREYPTLIGQRFGKLLVKQQVESSAEGQRRWLCRCDCGNECITTTHSLRKRPFANCGCLKSPDLTGVVFGRLTVLGRSEKRSPRGKRTTPLWECKCTCGNITYKATDTLTNPDESMCQECAGRNAAKKARANAGFVAGTQITKIKTPSGKSDNLSGVRGVYLDPKTGKYRARLKFRGKIYNLGCYTLLEDAVKARQRAEEDIFGKFLDSYQGKHPSTDSVCVKKRTGEDLSLPML